MTSPGGTPGELCRAIVENSADAVALLDAEGTLLFVSGPIERLTGFAPQELVGNDAFALVHPDDLPHAREEFRRALLSSEPVRIEYRARHKDGSWRPRDVIGINRLSDPAIGAIVVNFRDTSVCSAVEAALLSERAQLQHRLNQTQKMDAVGRLAGGIAHDFNNLLSVVLSYSDLMLAKLQAGDVQRV